MKNLQKFPADNGRVTFLLLIARLINSYLIYEFIINCSCRFDQLRDLSNTVCWTWISYVKSGERCQQETFNRHCRSWLRQVHARDCHCHEKRRNTLMLRTNRKLNSDGVEFKCLFIVALMRLNSIGYTTDLVLKCSTTKLITAVTRGWINPKAYVNSLPKHRAPLAESPSQFPAAYI